MLLKRLVILDGPILIRILACEKKVTTEGMLHMIENEMTSDDIARMEKVK